MTYQPEQEILSDIGALVAQLATLGYEPISSGYSPESFGNYHLDLNAGESWLRIFRDGSQYFAAVASEQVRRARLLRAFDDREAFGQALLELLAQPNSA